jgi:hypothetical protein
MKLAAALAIFVLSSLLVNANELKVRTKATQSLDGIVTKISISTESSQGSIHSQFQGVVRSICFNKQHSLCAVNIKSGTEINDILIARLSDGHVELLKDVTVQLQKALSTADSSVNTDFIVVDHIDGMTLSVSCGAKDEPQYEARIDLLTGNRFSVEPKSITKISG